MNTRQLEIFVNIVRCGNFSNAAKKMYLSQPAISANIDMLEKELNCKLLIRQGRKTALTEKGSIFYEYCLKALSITEEALEAIKADSAVEGNINIISSFVPGLYLLPLYMKGFRDIYPSVQFSVAVKNSRDACDGVLNSRYDIGFAGEVFNGPSFRTKKIFTDEMVLAVSDTKAHRELPETVTVDEFKKMPFITRSPGSNTISTAEKSLEAVGCYLRELNRVAEFDNGDAVVQAVIADLGVSVLPKICVKDVQGILSLSIKDVVMKRDFFAIIQDSEYIPPKVLKMFEFLPSI